MRPSYLYNGNLSTGKTISLHWDNTQVISRHDIDLVCIEYSRVHVGKVEYTCMETMQHESTTARFCKIGGIKQHYMFFIFLFIELHYNSLLEIQDPNTHNIFFVLTLFKNLIL